MKRNSCCFCGKAVTTSWHERKIPYGEEGSKTALTVEVPVRYCGTCDESCLDWEGHEISHNAVCAHHGVLTPNQIKAIRKRSGLSKDDFANLTGINKFSLTRWETGLIIQDLATDRYLRLLQNPMTIHELPVNAFHLEITDDDRFQDSVKFPSLTATHTESQSYFQLIEAS